MRKHLAVGDGSEAHLLVRPEHVAIAQGGAPVPNRIGGRVLTHVYQGVYTLTRIDAGALGVLQSRTLGGDVIASAPIGSKIDIGINLEQAVILAG